MKKIKILYWSSTILISTMMLMSAIGYFFNPEMIESFEAMGFPSFFRIELGVAKILGALVLLLPLIPKVLKQFAYFGFILTFISASIAHFALNDPSPKIIMPLIILALLGLSYYTNGKIHEQSYLKTQ